MSGEVTTEAVADLISSGRIGGEARIVGVVTAVDQRRNKAEHDWAVLWVDDGTGAVEVQVFPKPWVAMKAGITVGRTAELTGRLNHDHRSGRLQLWATGLAPTEH